MQRSLRSDSLKVEKLNTKLDFKSARVTQDFRAIFTQSGNTVLLVYIDHHDDAYLWASNRLQGFDTASAKPVYEYFEQAKVEDFDTIEDESIDLASDRKSGNPSKDWRFDPRTGVPLDICADAAPPTPKRSLWQSIKKALFALFFFLLGYLVNSIIHTILYFM